MSSWLDKRVRAPLTASIPGDHGLQDAMVQWIDYEILHVLTRDRLPQGRRVRLYLDVPPQGRMVELELEVQEIARPGATATRGWLHRCRYRSVEDGEGVFLESSIPSISPSARRPTRWASQSRSSTGSTSRSRASKSRSKASSSGTRSRSASSMSSRGAKRQRVEPPEVQLSVGTGGAPPNLLVRFSDADQLAGVIQVERGAFWVRLELEASLPIGGELSVALQLPDHQFIQARAIIQTSHGRFYEIKASGMPAADLGVLRRALGEQSDPGSTRRT